MRLHLRPTPNVQHEYRLALICICGGNQPEIFFHLFDCISDM
jgi:hypothetical protein